MVSAYTTYGRTVLTSTPQSQPIPGRDMMPNNAGGWSFKISDWERLNRFLVLGSVGGTYYVGQTKLTTENADVVLRCIAEDGPRVVEMAEDVNLNNRAPKTDQQLFVLALALKHGDQKTKNKVSSVSQKVLRTGTQLLHFVAMLDNLKGWNRSKRRIVKEWLESHEADHYAYQALKYQSRDGWSMKDVLRVAHPKAPSTGHAASYDWTCGRAGMRSMWPQILLDHAVMRDTVADVGAEAVLKAIDQHVPREALPTEWLSNKGVWQALVPEMGLHALLRNLGAMTANGALDASGGIPEVDIVAERLCNADRLRKARVHPFAIMLAALVYKRGQGFRSDKTWTPIRQIIEALDDAYELSFSYTRPTGKRILVGIDISGSMTAGCQGTPISCCTAAAAMAIQLARIEPFATVVQFDTDVRRIIPITKRTPISSLESATGGGTDVSAPVRWAAGEGPSARLAWSMFGNVPVLPQAPPQEFDAIIILTDSETWHGRIHCAEALNRYRASVAPNCKLVVAAMAANHSSVVDPDDMLSLGMAGLDANLPSLISDFIAG